MSLHNAPCKGRPVVQLDFYTSEYLGTYRTVTEFANDYDIPPATVSHALNRKRSLVSLPKHTLLLIDQERYETLLISGVRDYFNFDITPFI